MCRVVIFFSHLCGPLRRLFTLGGLARGLGTTAACAAFRSGESILLGLLLDGGGPRRFVTDEGWLRLAD